MQASGDVFIDGVGTTDPSEIVTTVGTGGIGTGGDIQIVAKSLVVTNGGVVNANTFGQGSGGNLRVQANQVVLDGVNTMRRFASGLSSEVGFDRSAGSGNGGNISVITRSLAIINGAGISTSTRAQGNAGNIAVQASESVVMGGLGNDGSFNQLTSEVVPGGVGNGGQISITTNHLALTQGARISSSSAGNGSAGNIEIIARQMKLAQQSAMTTETASGNGGNINLYIKDVLLLRHGSLISTTADTAQAGGNGGNITIGSPFILGVLGENSDIIANAFTGQGGNINISTNAIYGLKFQPKLTPFSDITASSEFGLRGTVTINTLNVDPNRGLVALPVNLTDPSQQISQHCKPGSKTSTGSFIATGRGGLPMNPDEPLEGRAVVTNQKNCLWH